jgi:protein-disulfide isomerase
VTVVEFADFQCPYCRNVQPALQQVLAAYPDDVRLVFRHYPLPFHERARPAARAAACAFAQGRFWEMAARVWASTLDDVALAADAADAGVEDLEAWTACLGAPATEAAIDADVALGDSAGVPGTPTFFVNGEALVGAAPYATFRDAVEAAKARAMASGIPRADYYRKAVLGLP